MANFYSLPCGGEFDSVLANHVAATDGVDPIGRQLYAGFFAEQFCEAQRCSRGFVTLANVMHFDQVRIVALPEKEGGAGGKLPEHGRSN